MRNLKTGNATNVKPFQTLERIDVNSFRMTNMCQLTKKQLYFLYKWLKTELEQGNNFFYNFKSIKNSFKAGCAVCLYDREGNIIGFMTYSLHARYAHIDIANIRADYKGYGLGRRLLTYLEETLKENGIMILELYCSPISSRSIWIALGFREFKDKEILSNNGRIIYLYKILVDYNRPDLIRGNYESFISVNSNVAMIWNTENLSQKHPIIAAVGANCTLLYMVGNSEIYNGVVKKFRKNYNGNYLIINTLKNDSNIGSNNCIPDQPGN